MPHDSRDHPAAADADALAPHGRLAYALQAVLLERRLVSPVHLQAVRDRMAARSPARGARVVAAAWTDPAFAAALQHDASAAVASLGIDPGPARLMALENTAQLHNVVVCTLCSCYPRSLLGPPPDWYKSVPYRARVVREPRAVLAEFGTTLPAGMALRVHDSTAELRYLVIPRRPSGTEGWTAERLAGLVTRDSMIGVSEARDPAAAEAGQDDAR
jgi:nitrile hydratase